MSYDIMKINDLLSNLIDNVSQNQLDKELKAFRFYAKKLGVRDYNSLWVTASEEDPSFVLQNELIIPSPVADREIKLYPSARLLVEKYNGNFYIYATKEEDLIQILETLDKFLNDEIPVEDFQDNHEDSNYEEENNSFIDIKECLKLRDKLSNNKYNLWTKYISENFTLAQKGTIATMLKESISDEEIYNYMQELHNDEEAMKNFYGVNSVNFRDPYNAAQEDANKDIKKGTSIDFDPNNEQKTIEELMNKENWTQSQAEDYLTYYWGFYENYLQDNYVADDDYTWSVEE